MINHDDIALVHLENTHKLGPFGPLEASQQAMVGSKAVYGILEQVESVQQAQRDKSRYYRSGDIPKMLMSAHLGLWRPLEIKTNRQR